jgi:catechol 2,3-dioxygenase-like lactoylglutathione lyase family enzyme
MTDPQPAATATRRGIPTATNVDHVAYTVPDLDQAVAFFVDVLGADLLYRLDDVKDDDGDWMRRQLGVHPRASAQIAMLRLGPVTNVELFEYESPDQERRIPRPGDGRPAGGASRGTATTAATTSPSTSRTSTPPPSTCAPSPA